MLCAAPQEWQLAQAVFAMDPAQCENAFSVCAGDGDGVGGGGDGGMHNRMGVHWRARVLGAVMVVAAEPALQVRCARARMR